MIFCYQIQIYDGNGRQVNVVDDATILYVGEHYKIKKSGTGCR